MVTDESWSLILPRPSSIVSRVSLENSTLTLLTAGISSRCWALSSTCRAVYTSKIDHYYNFRIPTHLQVVIVAVCILWTMYRVDNMCKTMIVQKVSNSIIRPQLFNHYSGTPLNGHPSTADTYDITDTFKCPECFSICFNTLATPE